MRRRGQKLTQQELRQQELHDYLYGDEDLPYLNRELIAPIIPTGPKPTLHEYLYGDELQFDLELEPAVVVERPIPPTVLPSKPREGVSAVPKPEKFEIDEKNQEAFQRLYFGFDLTIPDDFFASSVESPRKKGRFEDSLEQKKYTDFSLFLKKVMYPELKDMVVMQDREREYGYGWNTPSAREDQNPDDEARLMEINYKMLSELCDIAENMKTYADHMMESKQDHADNAFFKVCEDFLNQYDDIFQENVLKGIDELQNHFYQQLKADEVIQSFFDALQETLVAMGKSGDLESPGSPISPLFSPPPLRGLYFGFNFLEENTPFLSPNQSINELTRSTVSSTSRSNPF